RDLARAIRQALSGGGAGRGERPGGQRRDGRDRSHGGGPVTEHARIEPRSFRYVPSDSGVATITLNRPDRLNALTFEVHAELRGTFAGLAEVSEVRSIVITGAGRGFCSGGDVEDIIGALFGRDGAGLHEFTTMTCDVILNIRRCGKPVIAAINGV